MMDSILNELSKRPRYYRRDGTPYPPGEEGLFAWAEDHKKLELRVVKQDTLENGLLVSTVWLGLDHSFAMQGPPLIFETMVFGCKHRHSAVLDQDRYSTEAEALAGHEVMMKKWLNPKEVLNHENQE